MKLFENTEVSKSVGYDAIPSSMRGKAVSVKDMFGNGSKFYIGDAKMHDANFAFLTSQLAKLHTKLLEPKAYFTYQKDIPFDEESIGGGFVDYVQYYSVSWSGIANELRNVVGNGANYIPRVNAGMSQLTANVYTFELAYDIRFIELEKLEKLQLQKSLDSVYNDAIAVAWDFFCQKIAYTGGDENHKGLFNHDDIVPVNIVNISKTGIVDGTVTDSALIGFFNGIIQKALENSNMNISVIPDKFLVPTWLGSALTGRTSAFNTKSLRSYIVEFNLAGDESDGSVKITIESRPALDNAGTNGVGRVVAYKKDKDFVRMDIPYPIQHYITLPNIEKMAYTTAFVGQVSEVQLPYNTSTSDAGAPVQYWDFIA